MASMTCATLERIVQALSTSNRFVSNFENWALRRNLNVVSPLLKGGQWGTRIGMLECALLRLSMQSWVCAANRPNISQAASRSSRQRRLLPRSSVVGTTRTASDLYAGGHASAGGRSAEGR